MVLKLLKPFHLPKHNFPLFDKDTNDSIDTTGVVVDDGNYDNGTFKDRDYDVRKYKSVAINIQNIGANAIKYKVQSTTKDFVDFDADISDDDFDKEEKAETSLAAGAQATGSVEVTGGPSVKAEGDFTLVSAVANVFADGVVTCASVEVGDTVTANNLVYTAVDGTKSDNTEFDQSGTNDQCAADLADSITNDTRSGTTGDLSATDSTDEATIVTDVSGTAGNAITLVTSNGTRLSVTGSGTLADGITADSVVVNGNTYTAVSGTKANNTEFDISGTDTQDAADLADSITQDTRPGITVPSIDVIASNTLGVVTVEAPLNDGAAGNAIDTVGSANITAEASTLENGVTSTMNGITVNGVQIMSGAVPWRTSDTLTGDDVATNINGFTSSPNYTAANVNGVVTITAVDNESSTVDVTSSTTVMTKTDVNMSGGAAGKADTLAIQRLTPEITALRIRAKESSGGSPGKLRLDIKASEK